MTSKHWLACIMMRSFQKRVLENHMPLATCLVLQLRCSKEARSHAPRADPNVCITEVTDVQSGPSARQASDVVYSQNVDLNPAIGFVQE